MSDRVDPLFEARGFGAVRWLTVVLSVFLGACQPDDSARVPGESLRGIVVIDIDTLRADHLGAYGYSRDTSPEIDKIARESIVFDWAMAQGPNTPPSQGSLLTGMYPSSHGYVLPEDRLPDSIDTLAELLSDGGFYTGAFVDGGFMSKVYGVDQGFEDFEEVSLQGLEAIGEPAVEWLRERSAEPFFLLIHTYDVHTPYQPPAPYDAMFTADIDPPNPGFEPDVATMEKVRTSVWTDDPVRLDEQDLEYAKARYDGGIRYVDTWVGTLRRELEELGLWDSILFIVVSDHGEEFGEHGSVLHEKLYLPVTRVPLIMRFPGSQHVGRVTDPVEGVDLLPTILEFVGLPVPQSVEGESLMPLARGDARNPGRARAFGESPYFGVRSYVADGEYRLLTAEKNDQVELYNYRSDPLELDNQANQLPEVVERLRSLKERWAARDRPDYDRSESGVPGQAEEQLRALGYIN